MKFYAGTKWTDHKNRKFMLVYCDGVIRLLWVESGIMDEFKRKAYWDNEQRKEFCESFPHYHPERFIPVED